MQNHQDRYGKTPLYVAVENNNVPMIEKLLALGRAKGADPLITTAQHWTILHAAVQADDEKLLESLVKLCA